MIQDPECETGRVPYSTFSETDSANYFTTITPLADSAIEIVRNRFIFTGISFDDSPAMVVTNE